MESGEIVSGSEKLREKGFSNEFSLWRFWVIVGTNMNKENSHILLF